MRHLRKVWILALALMAGLMFSCSKEEGEPTDMGYDYFPLEQGSYIIYTVESIIWDDNDQTIDTTNYRVKMQIDTTFTDNLGRLSYRWLRYIQADTATRWTYDHTFALTRTAERMESVEGNNRFVRLAFPVKTAISWDVNAFNTEDALQAKYIDVGFSKSIGGKTFDDCALVLLEDNSSLINEYYQEEVYARGIGMIRRYDRHVDKKFTGEITKGYQHTYSILTYGKN
jgi:hypothetical protein